MAFEAIGCRFESCRVRQSNWLPSISTGVAAALGGLLLVGCTLGPGMNPSLPLTESEAHQDLERLRRQPCELARPLVVVGGFLDPNLGSSWLARRFRQLTGDRSVLAVDLFRCVTFDDCRRRIVQAVDGAFPSEDSTWTTEVDVIGISLGGLAARYAALPPSSLAGDDGERALRVARLFTLGSPHQGARFADLPAPHPLARAMRRGSPFLGALEKAEQAAGRAFEIFPYAQWGDSVVGVENAAPAGSTCWWTPPTFCPFPHVAVVLDPRIQADIARRLRGEPPHALEPRVEPPPRRGVWLAGVPFSLTASGAAGK